MTKAFSIWDYTRDADRAENGAKLIIVGGANPISVMVGRIHTSNPAFQGATDRLKKTHQSQLDALRGDALQKLQSDITTEAAKSACVLSWTGFTDRNGAALECNAENIDMIERELPELFDMIIAFGITPSNYVGTFDEDETLKNSQTVSDSSLSTATEQASN